MTIIVPRILKQVFFMIPLMVLGGCISLLPDPGPQPKYIDLNPTPAPLTGSKARMLVIGEPKVPQIFDDTKIIVKKQSCSGLVHYSHISQNAWVERLPTMLQNVLISSFRSETGLYVTDSSKDMFPDYRLEITVSQFNIVEPGAVEIVFYASLIDEKNYKVVASKEFKGTVFSENKVSSYIQAFNLVMSQVIEEMSHWLRVYLG